jgi:murein DD-endopeptidase MepM/ murein hydrolase activator NlpD
MIPLIAQPDMQIDEARVQALVNAGSTLQKDKTSDKEQIRKAAAQFEEFMVGYVYKNMYNSVEKSEFSGNTFAQDIFMNMFIDESVKKNGMGERGIAAMIVKQSEGKIGSHAAPSLSELDATRADPVTKVSDKAVVFAKGNDAGQESLLGDLSAMAKGLNDKMTSGFGVRKHPIYKVDKFHDGVDFAMPMGTPLNAPADGKVLFAGKKGGYGNMVVIDHGQGITSSYAHLSELGVKEGDLINKNRKIGKVGSTGLSTGPHLHFEVRRHGKPVDPRRLVSDQGEETAQGFESCTDKDSEA